MRKIIYHSQFKKDFKLAIKRGYDEKILMSVIQMLANNEVLPIKYRDHYLISSKNYKNARECHLAPDWLLIYHYSDDMLYLDLLRTGTHCDVF